MAEDSILPAEAAPTIAAAVPAAPPVQTAEEKAAAAAAASKEAVKLLLDPSGDAPIKIVKAKGSKNVAAGIVHVISTFNNTLVTVTDLKGNVIGWSSAGKMASKAAARAPPTPPRWYPRMPAAKPWVTDSAKSKSASKVPVQAVNPPSVPSKPSVSTCSPSKTSPLFPTTAAALPKPAASNPPLIPLQI